MEFAIRRGQEGPGCCIQICRLSRRVGRQLRPQFDGLAQIAFGRVGLTGLPLLTAEVEMRPGQEVAVACRRGLLLGQLGEDVDRPVQSCLAVSWALAFFKQLSEQPPAVAQVQQVAGVA